MVMIMGRKLANLCIITVLFVTFLAYLFWNVFNSSSITEWLFGAIVVIFALLLVSPAILLTYLVLEDDTNVDIHDA